MDTSIKNISPEQERTVQAFYPDKPSDEAPPADVQRTKSHSEELGEILYPEETARSEQAEQQASPNWNGYQEFKIPDDMDIDVEMLNKATPQFREAGLDQAAAQRMIDLYCDSLQTK